jgi:hypothetical protein
MAAARTEDVVSTDRPRTLTTLDGLDELTPADRVARLADLGRALMGQAVPPPEEGRDPLVKSLVDLVQQDVGSAQERLALGAALGVLGDPRLRLPTEDGYWATVRTEDGDLRMGRFMVTNHEYHRFVEAGGYEDDALWDDEGRAWRDQVERDWRQLSTTEEARPFVVPNQPVVGVTWFEATAYARWVGARLPQFEERLWATRGPEKRPYPWGSPFGEGNANTQEEVLGQPCAVGLYQRDRTPEGIYDLAGNVAEWCSDGVGDERWVHPGAWDQPSMAAWAKARVLERPGSWSPALGFRLSR